MIWEGPQSDQDADPLSGDRRFLSGRRRAGSPLRKATKAATSPNYVPELLFQALAPSFFFPPPQYVSVAVVIRKGFVAGTPHDV